MMSNQQVTSAMVSVVTMGGRRPSTDGYFSKKDLFVKPAAVNLVKRVKTILSCQDKAS